MNNCKSADFWGNQWWWAMYRMECQNCHVWGVKYSHSKVFGAKKLDDVAQCVGSGCWEVKKCTNVKKWLKKWGDTCCANGCNLGSNRQQKQKVCLCQHYKGTFEARLLVFGNSCFHYDTCYHLSNTAYPMLYKDKLECTMNQFQATQNIVLFMHTVFNLWKPAENMNWINEIKSQL